MVQRLTYRKRHGYATKSNQTRVVKTPGKDPILPLPSSVLGILIPHLRPAEYKRSRLARSQRTVNRAYGGVLAGSAVRERLGKAA
ncbi:hypothetical protein BHE74_00029904 [Ensete ventricosum]|nr:hypothetical protein GW17_00036944 [Ensete ventricosum]RWW62944.1 hypothetical protein BHE74_00029904 [Ensete ventricosum]